MNMVQPGMSVDSGAAGCQNGATENVDRPANGKDVKLRLRMTMPTALRASREIPLPR